MRLQKTISLDESRSATINELTVRQARNILARAKDLEKDDVFSLIRDRFDELTALLDDCIVLPDGETLEDITFSEVNSITDAFLEVNAAFLALMPPIEAVQETPSATSTPPVSPSSSEAIPT